MFYESMIKINATYLLSALCVSVAAGALAGECISWMATSLKHLCRNHLLLFRTIL